MTMYCPILKTLPVPPFLLRNVDNNDDSLVRCAVGISIFLQDRFCIRTTTF